VHATAPQDSTQNKDALHARACITQLMQQTRFEINKKTGVNLKRKRCSVFFSDKFTSFPEAGKAMHDPNGTEEAKVIWQKLSRLTQWSPGVPNRTSIRLAVFAHRGRVN